MQHRLTLLTAPWRMPINNRPISKVKSLWLLLVPELPSCPAALVIGSITSTYIKLWLHCNHNHPSSVRMSAPIPLKTASLLETDRVGCDFTVYCQTACNATESKGDTTLINRLRVGLQASLPKAQIRSRSAAKQCNKLAYWNHFWTGGHTVEICSVTSVFVTINVPNINKANITGDSLGFCALCSRVISKQWFLLTLSRHATAGQSGRPCCF